MQKIIVVIKGLFHGHTELTQLSQQFIWSAEYKKKNVASIISDYSDIPLCPEASSTHL